MCSWSSSFCTTNGGPQGWRRSCEVTEWVLVMCLMWIRTTETETANRISRQKQRLAPGFFACLGNEVLWMYGNGARSVSIICTVLEQKHRKSRDMQNQILFFKVISKYNRLTDWRVSLQLIFFLQTPSSLLKIDHKPCGNVATHRSICRGRAWHCCVPVHESLLSLSMYPARVWRCTDTLPY